VYQILSLTRPTTNTSSTVGGLVEGLIQPLPVPIKPIGAAGASIREALTLWAFDALAVVAVSQVAASSWGTTLIRTAGTAVALGLARLYRARLQFSVLDDLARIAFAVTAAAAVVGGAWPFRALGSFPVPFPTMPWVWVTAQVAAVVCARVIAYTVLRRHRRRSPGRATIVVGCGDLAIRLADGLRKDPTYGLAPVGFVGPPILTQPSLPVLAPVNHLEKAVARYRPLHLIVAFAACPDADLVSMLRRCRRYGVTVHVVPRLFELAVGRSAAETVQGIPLVRLRPEPTQLHRWILKRLMDICGATVGLVLLMPVFLLCALAVRWECGRHSVLFRQKRLGCDGKPFTILKFRSLTPSSARESQVKWNVNSDVRLGPVGKFLRSSSLDELPQLFNVLRGDMSLVGPRPERPYFVKQFQRTYAGYLDRHRVPVGMTGWAQIHGMRGDTSIDERVRLDNHYIEHWSLGFDLKIILRTVGSVVSTHRNQP